MDKAYKDELTSIAKRLLEIAKAIAGENTPSLMINVFNTMAYVRDNSHEGQADDFFVRK